MALTKEDLQAIGALMEVEREHTRRMIQEETAPLVARLDSVEEKLETVRNSQMKVELEQFPRIAAALEGVSGVNEKFHRLDKLEDKQEDHGNRILALEYALEQAK